MNQNTANARIIKGLIARLEMDSDFGVDFVSVTDNINSLIEKANDTGKSTPEPVANPIPAPANSYRKPAEIPAPPPSPSREPREAPSIPSRTAGFSPSAPPQKNIVSLVPFIEAPGSPEKESALAALRDECMTCRACELCQRRSSVVWGEGCLDAKVMFIGEGPGRDEDLEGRPFVGRSGRLLTDIIEKGMKTPRNHVYIANVVKCRPPGNRDPKPDEAAACSRYLSRQIEVIAPKAVVAVGNVAGRALLGLEPGASGLRGRWHEHRGVPMRVIYHPSYLLRQRRGENDRTDADKITWKDIQEVMAKLNEGA